MQNIILEEPYVFVPPMESDWWCWLLRFRLRGYMRKNFAVHSFECRHTERLKASIDAGMGAIIAPNHCRLSDPMAIGYLAGHMGIETFSMASWHLFKQGWYQRFMIQRMGAFSVYREGNDRAAVNQAIDLLVAGRRPLIIFPEGAVSRHNDLLMELMEGPGFIARQAAKRREKAGQPGVVIHPVAIRYSFDGDVLATIGKDVDAFEESFSWQPRRHLPLAERLGHIGKALLALKEIEYFGATREGDAHERAQRLIVEVLERLEAKWNCRNKATGVVARVKNIRAAILPDLIEKKCTPDERTARWQDLAACYYIQQISHYPRDYVRGEDDLPERLLETVERMEEDFTDRSNYHGPLHCTMVVGEAIAVSPERDRAAEVDPAMQATADSLQAMLDGLVAERKAKLGFN